MSVYSPVFYSFSFRASFPDTLDSFQTPELSFSSLRASFNTQEFSFSGLQGFLSRLLAYFLDAMPQHSFFWTPGPPFQADGFFIDTRAFSFFWFSEPPFLMVSLQTPELSLFSGFQNLLSWLLFQTPTLSFPDLQGFLSGIHAGFFVEA